MNIPTVIGKTISALAICAVMVFEVHAAAEAGKVTFAFGDTTIAGLDGGTRPARRGAVLFSGDTISTGERGRVQMRFTDGGFVSLIPDTSFKIDEYRFEGEADGNEKGFFSLIKGGMRALTGLVGKKNRETYRLNTVVSTIGIRGTLYRTVLERIGESYRQLVSVGFDPTDPEGGVKISAAGITVPVNPGQNAVVEGDDAPPRLTTEQAQVAAAPPAGESGTETADESSDVDQSSLQAGRNESGIPAATLSEVHDDTPVPDDTPIEGGVLFGLDHVVAGAGVDIGASMLATDIVPADSLDIEESSFAIYFTDGQAITGALSGNDFEGEIDLIDVNIAKGLQEVLPQLQLEGVVTNAEYDAALADFLSMPATNHDVGSDDATGLVWGRWAGGYVLVIDFFEGSSAGTTDLFASAELLMDSVHWIYGPRATSLPTMGVGAYAFIPGAATSSTVLAGGGIGTGMTGGMVRVDYGSLVVAGDSLTVNHGGEIRFNTSGSLIPDPNGGGAGFLTSGSGSGSACGMSGCNAYLNGYLTNMGAGEAPDGIAAAYKLAPNLGDGSGDNTIMGVGGFALDHYNAAGSLSLP